MDKYVNILKQNKKMWRIPFYLIMKKTLCMYRLIKKLFAFKLGVHIVWLYIMLDLWKSTYPANIRTNRLIITNNK